MPSGGQKKWQTFFLAKILGGNSLIYHPQATPAQATTAQAITAHVSPQIITSKMAKFSILSSFEPIESQKYNHTPKKAAVLSIISYLSNHHIRLRKREIF
jgi:hypothetical protein